MGRRIAPLGTPATGSKITSTPASRRVGQNQTIWQFTPQVINAFPRWGSTPGWLYPQSHLFRAELRAVLLPLLGDDIAYEQLYSRTEYRTAIVQHRCDTGRFRAAPGEFIGEWQWDGDILKWETDFRATADPAVWGFTPGAPAEDDDLTALAAELARSRRYG